jgi:hypothetical protein
VGWLSFNVSHVWPLLVLRAGTLKHRRIVLREIILALEFESLLAARLIGIQYRPDEDFLYARSDLTHPRVKCYEILLYLGRVMSPHVVHITLRCLNQCAIMIS